MDAVANPTQEEINAVLTLADVKLDENSPRNVEKVVNALADAFVRLREIAHLANGGVVPSEKALRIYQIAYNGNVLNALRDIGKSLTSTQKIS